MRNIWNWWDMTTILKGREAAPIRDSLNSTLHRNSFESLLRGLR